MATIGGLTYKPSAISDADAAALATGVFELTPHATDELFSNGEQGAVYEVSPEYLYQDAAGTIPVTASGDPVGYVRDLSGNGHHATQSVSASRPIYRTDGVLHWLEFDGVDDYLSLGTFPMPTDFWQALSYDTNGDTAGLFWTHNDAATPWTHIFQSGSTNAALTEFTSFNQLHVDGNSASYTTRDSIFNLIAGNHVTVWNSTTVGADGAWRFGKYTSPAFILSGKLYGMVWRDRLTDIERGDLEQYLATLNGVTL